MDCPFVQSKSYKYTIVQKLWKCLLTSALLMKSKNIKIESHPFYQIIVTAGPPRQPRMPMIGPCQVLAATLTLSQPGGADYAYPLLGSLAS